MLRKRARPPGAARAAPGAVRRHATDSSTLKHHTHTSNNARKSATKTPPQPPTPSNLPPPPPRLAHIKQNGVSELKTSITMFFGHKHTNGYLHLSSLFWGGCGVGGQWRGSRFASGSPCARLCAHTSINPRVALVPPGGVHNQGLYTPP